MIDIKTLASASKGNCYHITDGSTPILIECGIKFKDIQIALDFKTSNIAGCLVSHEHKDHSKGIKDVLQAGIDVYASQGTIESENITHHLFLWLDWFQSMMCNILSLFRFTIRN